MKKIAFEWTFVLCFLLTVSPEERNEVRLVTTCSFLIKNFKNVTPTSKAEVREGRKGS